MIEKLNHEKLGKVEGTNPDKITKDFRGLTYYKSYFECFSI